MDSSSTSSSLPSFADDANGHQQFSLRHTGLFSVINLIGDATSTSSSSVAAKKKVPTKITTYFGEKVSEEIHQENVALDIVLMKRKQREIEVRMAVDRALLARAREATKQARLASTPQAEKERLTRDQIDLTMDSSSDVEIVQVIKFNLILYIIYYSIFTVRLLL